MHVRAQIRAHVVTLLKANVSGVSQRVFPGRVWSLQTDELPALCVFTGIDPERSETIIPDDFDDDGELAGDVLQRLMPLVIDIHERAPAPDDFGNEVSPEDSADEIAAEVETAMGADRTLGGLAKRSWLSETRLGLAAEGERATSVTRLTYTIEYWTAEDTPSTAL